jgi:hypothetical protein
MKGLFLFATASRPSLGSTQPPIPWVPMSLSLGVKLTTLLHVVPRLRIHEAIPPLPQYVFMAWHLFKHGDNLPLPYLNFILISVKVRKLLIMLSCPTCLLEQLVVIHLVKKFPETFLR